MNAPDTSEHAGGSAAPVVATPAVHGSPARTAWCSAVLLGLLFSLPLVQPRHTHPITSFYSEWLAFMLGAAALCPLLLRRYSAPLQVQWTAFVPLALAAVLSVHLVTMKSAYPQQPLLAILYLLWGTALAVAAGVLRLEFGLEKVAALLATFLLAGGLVNALAGVLQYYEWRGAFEFLIATKLGYQVYGNLGQPNHFATHIVLALASLGLLYATGRATLGWTIAGAAMMLFVLSLSGSRSAWVYLIAVAILGAVRHRGACSAESRRAMVFALALLPGLAAAHLVVQLPWLASPTLHTTAIERIFTLAATPSERLQLWREAWAMFLSAPLLGVGWGQFAWHNFMLTGKFDGMALTGLYNHAHNLLLQLLAETGVAGGAVVLAGIVLWVRNAAPVVRQPAGMWIWACVSVLGAHSMLEYPLWNSYFLGIACVVLGLGDTRSLQLHQARLARAGIALFMAGTAWFGAELLDRYYRLESVMNARYSASSRAVLERAHRQMLDAGTSFLLAPYVELAYARDIDLNTMFIGTKLAFTTRVMHFAPTGMVAYRHAALTALADNEEEARVVLRQAALAYPGMLQAFAGEFSKAATGNPQAQARFAEALRALDEARHRSEVTPGR